MDIALSLLVLAVVALVVGAIFLLRRGGHRKQAGLMLVLAAVMIVNIAIWTLPDRQGRSLAGQAKVERAPD